MEKNKEEKELYLAPRVEVIRLASPLSFLVSYSGNGNLGQYEDGEELSDDFGLSIGHLDDGGELD